MRDKRVINLAASNVRNLVAQNIYLKTGFDFTRPIQTYGLLTKRCNCKCKMCDFWREEKQDDLPTEVWIRFLKELKSFAGTYNINFSGGEPMLRKDIFEILDCCRKLGVPAGITSNGALINEKTIPRLLDTNIFNINVSLDSLEDSVHDDMRGTPGLLAKLRNNLDLLMEAKRDSGSSVRVILKSIVCAENLDNLIPLAEYARDMGMTGISYQPIFDWSEESKDMSGVDQAMLSEVVSQLVDLKQQDYPILNSEHSIKQWPGYFDGTLAGSNSPCSVPLRELFVYPQGDIIFCGTCNPVIGNITENDIRTIWFSEKARKVRKALVKCEKMCLQTCVVKRGLKDYLELLRRLS